MKSAYRRARDHPRRPPDLYHVHGVAGTGEEIDCEFESRELAEYVAARITARKGRVTCTRLVYNSPAAAWVEPAHPYGRRFGDANVTR
jgi:hypothetical protein